MLKRGDMPADSYCIRFADMNDPKGAQEFYVNKHGESELYRHGIGGNYTAGRVNIPPDTLVIRIRS